MEARSRSSAARAGTDAGRGRAGPRLRPRAPRRARSTASPSTMPTCRAFRMPASPATTRSWWSATLEGVRVAVLGGRAHYYERGDAGGDARAARGAEARSAPSRLILTNAAGSFRPDIPPGELMLIADHINFSGRNPLIGEPTDAPLRQHDRRLRPGDARAPSVPPPRPRACRCPRASTPGTRARASRPRPRSGRSQVLGADAVGMSTVPEVILARFLGLRVAAISTITNMAAGMSDEELSHEHTKAMAPLGAAKLERVLRRYLRAARRGAAASAARSS